MPHQPKPKNIPNVPTSDGNDRMNLMSQMLGQSLEAEEQMPPPQPRRQQSLPQPLSPMPGQDITIAGNNFAPADIEHLVTTAQEPPTEFQNEVQAELDRLQQARASKT